MTAQGRYPGGFHPRRSAADHDDLFPAVGRLEGKLISPAEGGVDPAADREGPFLPGKTLQARRAGGDILQSALGDLLRVLGVGEETPVHTDQVRHPVLEDPLAELRVQPSGGNHGNGHRTS